MRQRAKAVALSTTAVGVLVSMVAGVVAKDRLLEEWYIFRLNSTDTGAVIDAAVHLGQLRSARSIPRLLRAYEAVQARSMSAGKPIGWFAEALRSIGPAAIPELEALLRVDGWELRALAVNALIMNEYAEPAIPALMATLTDEDEQIRRWAAGALGSLGSKSAPAIPALLGALQKENESHVQWDYVRAVGRIGVRTQEVVAALEPLRTTGDLRLRAAVAQALAQIQEKPSDEPR